MWSKTLPVRFPVKIHRCRTGSVLCCCVVCIVTLSSVLCKWFLRGWQLENCIAIDKEESISAVSTNDLCNKICRALIVSLVNVFTEAVIGYIHLT